MKKCKLIAILTGLTTMFSSVTFAAGAPIIDAKQVPFTDTVDVKITDASPNTLITVKITNSEGEADFYEVGYVDENGNFGFSYINDRNSGEMNVEAQIGVKRITGSYFKMGDAIYNEFISAIEEQHELPETETPSGETIKSVFDKYDGKFEYEKTAYDALSEEKQENVFDTMAKDPSFKGEIDEFKDVVDAFYAAVLLECYNENPDDFKNMLNLDVYKEVVDKEDIAPVLTESIKTISESKLERVWDAVPDNQTNSKKLFQDIEFEIFRSRVVNAGSWNDVKEMYTLYKDLIGIDPSDADYNDYKALIGKNLNSYSAYKNAFLNETSDKNTSNIKPTPGNTGGGSGSGGSGGGGGVGKGTGSIAPVKSSEPTKDAVNNNASDEVGKLPFEDLTEAKWAIKAVGLVSEKGIMVGVGNGKFEPNRAITRAEAVKIVMLMTGEAPGGEVPFEDVKTSDWFHPYVAAAYKLGIVKGKSETFFDPHALLTRQEMAVMVYNALTIGKGIDADAKSSTSPNIVDRDQIATWAVDAVEYLYAKNIIAGRLGYVFDPVDNMTRAEAATVIYNIIK